MKERLSESFKSLRLRLLLSYILILVLALAIIGVTLVFVLRGSNFPSESASLGMANAVQRFLGFLDQQNIKIPDDGPTKLQIAGLRTFIRQTRVRGIEVRLIFLNSLGAVSFDSGPTPQNGAKLTLDAQTYTTETAGGQTQIITPLVRGTFADADGTPWWFVGQAPDAANQAAQRLMIAIKAPRLLTLPEVLSFYGSDIFLPLLQAGVVGLIAAFLMSLILTRSVARPLQDVAKAAVSVAEGKFDQRAPVRGPAEVRTVAEAFNQMTEQVAAAQQAQRDFLANVTHDLRTPLTSIQGFSQAIMDGVASNPEAAQRAAQIIHDEAGRLNRMVEELLDLARIEAGRMTMTRQSLQITDVLNAVGERLTPRAATRGLKLSLEVPASLPLIAGDGDRMAQVYTNLIDNAIKHTPEGGTVTLRAGNYDNGILIQVCDTGEGIPADDIPRLFDRFYQVDKSRQREKREGAGLGLTITKQIVEAHGGKIWVESQEGAWTIFSTWYPMLRADSTTIIRRRPASGKQPATPVPQKTP